MKDKNLKIAIQKSGRLSDSSVEILKGIGLDFEEYKRQLFVQCSNFPANILYTRDDDIPNFVESGAADIGIIGGDVLEELGVNVEIIQEMDFGKCALKIAVKEDSTITKISDLECKRIATTFPKITKKFFDSKGVEVEIVVIQGGVELAPNIGIADAIVDLVSTGFTLKVNNLRVVETIFKSQAVLIKNKDLDKSKEDQINKLVERIKGLKRARNSKYIMLNAPKEILEDIKNLVPGLKSPTIAKLAQDDWISVQTVVEEDIFWDVIEKLKELGARDIIVMPIEKIIY